MKSIIYSSLLFLFGQICLTSCNKTEVNQGLVNNKRLLNVLQLKGDAQRTAFNLLSAEDKLNVWRLHIDQFASEKNLGTQQVQLLKKLSEANRADFYAKESDEKELAIAVFRENWIEKAKLVFSVDEIYSIAFTLNDLKQDAEYFSGSTGLNTISRNQTAPDRSPYNDESLPNCNCSVGSSMTCPKFTFTWDSGDEKMVASVGYNPCTYNAASKCDVDGGCGFMGWSACDGNKCG